MRFEAIIFDFDGVIVDSEIVSNAALAAVLTELGRPITTNEAVARYSGHRWSDCHRLIEADFGRPLDSRWLENLVDEAIAARVDEVLAIEGIETFLRSQSHRKLAVASSSEEAWLHGFLARLGLAGYFGGHVYSATAIARGKPHPDVYLMAAERLGLAPASCLVIEDHPIGAAAGVAADMTVIGLLAASHIGEGHADALKAAGAHHIAATYGHVADIIARLETAS